MQVVRIGLLPDLEQKLTKDLDALLEGKNLAAETLAAAKERSGEKNSEPADQPNETSDKKK